MTPLPMDMAPEETQRFLLEALRRLEGVDARIETWIADDSFTAYGKHRVVRYDLEARVGGARHPRRYRWLGKFYDREDDARRVGSVLTALAASDDRARIGVVVPSVLAYHPPRHLLLLTYELGESLTSAIGQDTDAILGAVGKTLASLHALPVSLTRTHSPEAVLSDIQPRIADLCGRFPSEAKSLRRAFHALESDAPPFPRSPSFVHGDFGPANLLWRTGHIVVLDFDKCALGDPASDLGNLFAQLFRMSLKKPEKLPDFTIARSSVLDAYRRFSSSDPDLERRVAWYERATLLRKIHGLLFSKNRPQEPAAVQQRQAEAVQLLRLA